MSNFAIVICLLIIVTTSEAGLSSKLLERKIKSSKQKVETAYKVATEALSVAKSRIHDLQDKPKQQEDPIRDELNVLSDEEKTTCFNMAEDVLAKAGNELDKIMNWALDTFKSKMDDSDRCKTSQKSKLVIQKWISAEICIGKLQASLPGIVALAKSQFSTAIPHLPTSAFEWSIYIRHCKKGDSTATTDGHKESEVVPNSHDLFLKWKKNEEPTTR